MVLFFSDFLTFHFLGDFSLFETCQLYLNERRGWYWPPTLHRMTPYLKSNRWWEIGQRWLVTPQQTCMMPLSYGKYLPITSPTDPSCLRLMTNDTRPLWPNRSLCPIYGLSPPAHEKLFCHNFGSRVEYDGAEFDCVANLLSLWEAWRMNYRRCLQGHMRIEEVSRKARRLSQNEVRALSFPGNYCFAFGRYRSSLIARYSPITRLKYLGRFPAFPSTSSCDAQVVSYQGTGV